MKPFNFQNTYSTLPAAFYTKCEPTPVRTPKAVLFNESLAEELGLGFSDVSDDERAAIFSGNTLPDGTEPLAQAYAGHQFGGFAMLGDGRAHLLGEHITPAGARFDIQFKGSGQTPYSRHGDGRAALGPMLREYVISEAMHALGISTTRSLAVVSTGEHVMRDTVLTGAILTRVASSHIRVGTFEYAAAREDIDGLKQLADYTINRHYPEAKGADNTYLALLQSVMKKQATLIAKWMGVGFVHGVMNTDNMTLSGESIDYGPCAFMEAYDPATVFSSIDEYGRYAYGNQPRIAQWNLARFAESLLPLLHKDMETAIDIAEETINSFRPLYEKAWLGVMQKKLGLLSEEKGDAQLILSFLNWMEKAQLDFTNTFRDLAEDTLKASVYQSDAFKAWHAQWRLRIRKEKNPHDTMLASNPAIIPRNHNVEEALDAAEQGDLSKTKQLLEALQEPFVTHSEFQEYRLPAPKGSPRYQTYCGT